jgi:hypothetical protein
LLYAAADAAYAFAARALRDAHAIQLHSGGCQLRYAAPRCQTTTAMPPYAACRFLSMPLMFSRHSVFVDGYDDAAADATLILRQLAVY